MKSISLFSGYIYLILAIITGIATNGFLKTTESFTKLTPTIFCITSIVVCIFCLSRAMTIIPVGFPGLFTNTIFVFAVTEFSNKSKSITHSPFFNSSEISFMLAFFN